MGRGNKYDTHVKPFLKEISHWYEDMNETQICERLGIARSSFESYKRQHPELQASLRKGKLLLVDDLKDSLRKKAKGFFYTETKKTFVKDKDGNLVDGTVRVEETEKYMPPDTGAIHLLLKNLDEDWRNDDKATMDMKREKLEIEKTKSENEW